MKQTAEYITKRFPNQVKDLLQAADEVAAKRFRFALRWDMERTQEPVVFEGDIDWLYQPGDDPEWVYAFNRMKFWIVLGQAYVITGDDKYAEAFVNQLKHWAATVKQDDPAAQKAWRTIEVGLRLEYWQKAYRYFKGSPRVTPEFTAVYEKSVREQAEFLMPVWDVYHLMSNWGVLENHGLFLAGVFLNEPRYVSEAMRRLSAELDMQVMRDGTHWEQSPMYHNEVLHCYLDVIQYAAGHNVPLTDAFKAKVKGMCYFDAYAGKPNGHELCFGDSDDIDQRDILTRAALLFNDSTLRSRGYEEPDFDAAWEMGGGMEAYAAITPQAPPQTDKYFSDSGNMFFRSGWGENAAFVHFHCGALGAGHGHADKLHIDLFNNGEDILLDAGRFSYVFGQDSRIRFKEVKAHNTAAVAGETLYEPIDSWLCHKLTRAVNQKFYSDERYGYAEGGHLGYGFLTNRRLVYIKPDILVICDEFYANEGREYERYYHFNNAGAPTIDGGKCRYKGKAAQAELAFLPPAELTLTDTVFSRVYNTTEPNKTLTARSKGDGFTSLYTVINLSAQPLTVTKVPVKSNFKGITFTDSEIEALEITSGERQYTVVFAHNEYASPTDTFNANGRVGFGLCVAFAAGEREVGTVLLW